MHFLHRDSGPLHASGDRPTLALFALALLCGLLAPGCTSQVGDTSQSSQECNTQDGAICDVSVPAGYCTVSPCVPNGCPEESVCVRFDEETSYCMKVCLSNQECREDHECRELGTYGEEGYGYCYIP